MLLIVQPLVGHGQPVQTLTIVEYRSHMSPDQPTMRGMARFADIVNRDSHGRLAVSVSADTVPGSPGEQIKTLQAGGPGAPDLMLLVTPALRHLESEFEIMDLPFLVRGERQAHALLDGPFGRALLSRLEGHGLTGLAWWENGFRQITTSGQPFRHALDLANRPVRVIPEPAFVETFKVLGADVVGLPYAELYGALKSGRIVAEDNFYSQILAGHLYDVQSAVSVTNHSYSAIAVVANSAVWQKLTVQDRSVLQHAALEAGRFERDLIREQVKTNRAELERHGMTVYTFTTDEIAKLVSLTEPVRQQFFLNYDPTIVDIYRREIAKR
ncbi:TRAP transporter substrate-binding protein [Paraburkholderia atlantica]|uniref:TRAP transporter substrate-binding protein n=1 Tax=Paraburkholderia atlantica TaxID=2654982 RepID=UPI00161AA1BC|nr:TRAP transporter substrate-binding protein [Paraburkholderia atlantica]MBB5420896.1 tripartite ATP-independent transporter DctP family solute receptor [Paraburkholderia atlantica]